MVNLGSTLSQTLVAFRLAYTLCKRMKIGNFGR